MKMEFPFKSKQLAKLAVSLFFLLFSSQLFSQSRYQWAYGGTQTDEGRSAVAVPGGGFLISGTTNSFGAGGNDFYLLGIDTCGEATFSRTVGGTSNENNFDMLQNFAGRDVLYGRTSSFGVADNETYLTELNAANSAVKTSWVVGDTLKEEGQAIIEARDTSGYVGAGFTSSYGAGNFDVYVIKYRYNGTIAWTKVIGGTNLDKAYDIQATSDGGYIVVGETRSFGKGKSDVYLLKLTSAGALSWSKTYGTQGDDIGYSVKQSLDGGYVITGYTELSTSPPNKKDVYVIKTTSTGTKTWSFAYGGSQDEEGHHITTLSDTSYAICGFTRSYGAGAEDDYLLKISKNGTLAWGRTYGGDTTDKCLCLLNTSDNGYLLTGQTLSFGAGKSDVYVIKTNSLGISGCNEDSGAVRYNVGDTVMTGGNSSSGGILHTGGVVNTPTTRVDTICNNCSEVLRINSTGNYDQIEETAYIFPNPVNSILNVGLVNSQATVVTIKIFDVSGKILIDAERTITDVQLDVSKLSNGFYFIEIETASHKEMLKFIKQ